MGVELNERQQRIMARLSDQGEVRVTDLKRIFPVTEMTIRRDLEKLESAGIAKRTFGGAILMGRDVALHERAGFRIEEKMRIGRIAAALVSPNDSIFLDGGTTTLQVAKCLKPGMPITVVTNALNIASELIGKGINTIVTGGTVLESTSSLVGPITVNALAGMAFDRVFLGATGVSARHGFSNSNIYEAEVKRRAMKQAADICIVIDASKFETKELFSFAAIGDVHRIVTDRAPSDEQLSSAFLEAGVEVIAGTAEADEHT